MLGSPAASSSCGKLPGIKATGTFQKGDWLDYLDRKTRAKAKYEAKAQFAEIMEARQKLKSVCSQEKSFLNKMSALQRK